MKITVTRILEFNAAHSLPGHPGKCRNVHGHAYRLEVTVGGEVQGEGPATGMVMDFSDLEAKVARLVVDRLDHTYLNDVLDFLPTAERIAVWVIETLAAAGLPVARVRLWETPASYAEVTW